MRATVLRLHVSAASESTSEIGLDSLLQLRDRHVADEPSSVDEEGWRGINLEFPRGAIADLFDVAEQFLICKAGLEALLGEAGLPGDRE